MAGRKATIPLIGKTRNAHPPFPLGIYWALGPKCQLADPSLVQPSLGSASLRLLSPALPDCMAVGLSLPICKTGAYCWLRGFQLEARTPLVNAQASAPGSNQGWSSCSPRERWDQACPSPRGNAPHLAHPRGTVQLSQHSAILGSQHLRPRKVFPNVFIKTLGIQVTRTQLKPREAKRGPYGHSPEKPTSVCSDLAGPCVKPP